MLLCGLQSCAVLLYRGAQRDVSNLTVTLVWMRYVSPRGLLIVIVKLQLKNLSLVFTGIDKTELYNELELSVKKDLIFLIILKFSTIYLWFLKHDGKIYNKVFF